MRFYLGTHVESWLWEMDIPLFVSRRRLYTRRTLPRARGVWALDSGGFSELSMYGHWTTDAPTYAREVRRYSEEIGGMEWAACQDWMCEPWLLKATGLTVQEHQRRTVENYLTLRTIAPDLPFIPVLQGWAHRDYMAHVEMYQKAGVDLWALPTVGLGSVCRRQHTDMVEGLIGDLQPMRLHGFGFKLRGLAQVGGLLYSADSMAWSFAARKDSPLEGCSHKNCANCRKYALIWYARVIQLLERTSGNYVQMRFMEAEAVA